MKRRLGGCCINAGAARAPPRRRDDVRDCALLSRPRGQEPRACGGDTQAPIGGIHHASPSSSRRTNSALRRVLREEPAADRAAVRVSEYETRHTPGTARTFVDSPPGSHRRREPHSIPRTSKGTPWNVCSTSTTAARSPTSVSGTGRTSRTPRRCRRRSTQVSLRRPHQGRRGHLRCSGPGGPATQHQAHPVPHDPGHQRPRGAQERG